MRPCVEETSTPYPDIGVAATGTIDVKDVLWGCGLVLHVLHDSLKCGDRPLAPLDHQADEAIADQV